MVNGGSHVNKERHTTKVSPITSPLRLSIQGWVLRTLFCTSGVYPGTIRTRQFFEIGTSIPYPVQYTPLVVILGCGQGFLYKLNTTSGLFYTSKTSIWIIDNSKSFVEVS